VALDPYEGSVCPLGARNGRPDMGVLLAGKTPGGWGPAVSAQKTNWLDGAIKSPARWSQQLVALEIKWSTR